MSYEPSHDEALLALSTIRKAQTLSDQAARVYFELKCEAKEAKIIAQFAEVNARNVARAQTRELPLFDERDGITPPPDPSAAETIAGKIRKGKQVTPDESSRQPLPIDTMPVSDLPLPPEVHVALAEFGFKTMASLIAWYRRGISFDQIPGIDSVGAERLETAVAPHLGGGDPESESDEGRAA